MKSKAELEELIQQMKAGLNNPNLNDTMRERIKTSLAQAEKQLADLEPQSAPKAATGVRAIVLDPSKFGAAPAALKKVSFSDYPLAGQWMPKHQKNLVARYEEEEKKGVLDTVEAMLKQVPGPYSQDGKGNNALVYAHYFYGNSDWYITEFHPDGEDDRLDRFYGYAVLDGDEQNAEMGYMDVDGFVNNGKVELDFNWEPQTLASVKGVEADVEEQQEPEEEPPVIQEPPVVAEAAPEPGCAVTRNVRKNGVEVRFQKTPDAAITDALKRKGFKWSNFHKVWYARYSESLMQFAVDLCQQTENTSNPAGLVVPAGNERLITLATLTSSGKVPQNLLKSEIEAGKLEFARVRRFDGMKDMEESIPEDEIVWQKASMDADDYDIEDLAKGRANRHWTDSITLDNDGTISYKYLKFRYLPTVKGFDYKPEEERRKIAESRQQELKEAKETAQRVVDLSADKYWVPFNRPPKDGPFVIVEDDRLKAADLLGQPAFPAVANVDGYPLVGTAEAKNVVTGTMTVFGMRQSAPQEIRQDRILFTAESGTVTPAYISLYTPMKRLEGEKTAFPGWKLPSFPTSTWEAMIRLAREAREETYKSKDSKKTERGIKIHQGKATEALTKLSALKKVWLAYEESQPGLLQQVTGQDEDEYSQMLTAWRKELNIAAPQKAVVAEPVRDRFGRTLKVGDYVGLEAPPYNSVGEVVSVSPLKALVYVTGEVVELVAQNVRLANAPLFKKGDKAFYKGKEVTVKTNAQIMDFQGTNTLYRYEVKASDWDDADDVAEALLSKEAPAAPERKMIGREGDSAIILIDKGSAKRGDLVVLRDDVYEDNGPEDIIPVSCCSGRRITEVLRGVKKRQLQFDINKPIDEPQPAAELPKITDTPVENWEQFFKNATPENTSLLMKNAFQGQNRLGKVYGLLYEGIIYSNNGKTYPLGSEWRNSDRSMDFEAFLQQAKSKLASARQNAEVLKKLEEIPQMMKIYFGKSRQIRLPNGEKHNAQFAIVELDDILASHNEETFADTPGYPLNSAGSNLNDRNYATDRNAQALVDEYARDLDPDLLLALSSTPEGTPIVTTDGIVVSGNNRTMSLKLARKKYPKRWQAYQDALRMDLDTFGLEDLEESRNDQPSPLSKMKAPVLVRVDYDFGDLTTANMAKYNASSTKAKKGVDRALELSITIREQALCEQHIPELLGDFDTLGDFYADRKATAAMLTALQQCGVINPQDMAALVDNGLFTEEGKTLVERVLSAVILEPEVVQCADRDGVRTLRQAVVYALTVLLANKALPADASLAKAVNDAVCWQSGLVASGLKFGDYLTQGNLFDTEPADYRTLVLNRLMASGQRKFREALRKYNNSMANASQGSALFASETVTPAEAFEGHIAAAIDADDLKAIKRFAQSKPKAPAAPVTPAQTSNNEKVELARTRVELLEKAVKSGRLTGDNLELAKTRLELLKKYLAKQ